MESIIALFRADQERVNIEERFCWDIVFNTRDISRTLYVLNININENGDGAKYIRRIGVSPMCDKIASGDQKKYVQRNSIFRDVSISKYEPSAAYPLDMKIVFPQNYTSIFIDNYTSSIHPKIVVYNPDEGCIIYTSELQVLREIKMKCLGEIKRHGVFLGGFNEHEIVYTKEKEKEGQVIYQWGERMKKLIPFPLIRGIQNPRIPILTTNSYVPHFILWHPEVPILRIISRIPSKPHIYTNVSKIVGPAPFIIRLFDSGNILLMFRSTLGVQLYVWRPDFGGKKLRHISKQVLAPEIRFPMNVEDWLVESVGPHYLVLCFQKDSVHYIGISDLKQKKLYPIGNYDVGQLALVQNPTTMKHLYHDCQIYTPILPDLWNIIMLYMEI